MRGLFGASLTSLRTASEWRFLSKSARERIQRLEGYISDLPMQEWRRSSPLHGARGFAVISQDIFTTEQSGLRYQVARTGYATPSSSGGGYDISIEEVSPAKIVFLSSVRSAIAEQLFRKLEDRFEFDGQLPG